MSLSGLTASALWRGEECPASMVLPASPRRYKDQEQGRLAHKKEEDRAPPGSVPEAAFAYNVLSGEARFLGSKIERAYGPLAHGEIAGTIDLLTVEEDRVCVDDFKSGQGYLQAPPETNPQLQHGAVCAALVHGTQHARAQLIYLKTGEVKDAEYDVFDLGAARLRMANIWRGCLAAEVALQAGGPQALIDNGLVRISSACWRCPAEKACPLKKGKKQ